MYAKFILMLFSNFCAALLSTSYFMINPLFLIENLNCTALLLSMIMSSLSCHSVTRSARTVGRPLFPVRTQANDWDREEVSAQLISNNWIDITNAVEQQSRQGDQVSKLKYFAFLCVRNNLLSKMFFNRFLVTKNFFTYNNCQRRCTQ